MTDPRDRDDSPLAAYADYVAGRSELWARGPQDPPAVVFGRQATIRTSRLTVAFRLVLALPHLVAVYLLTIAAEIVTVIAWFSAVVTAQVPAPLYEFLAWVLRYSTRVAGYLNLLTDRWPSFRDRDGQFPVLTTLPGPERLNRLAVIFRLFLMIPAAVVSALLVYGLLPALVVIWLVVLVLGRVPTPVFDSVAATVRYQTRYYAFGALLTSTYPTGLFGDPPDRVDDEPAFEPPPEQLMPPRMGRGARRLVVLWLVLGGLAFAGYLTAAAIGVLTGADRAEANRELISAYQHLDLDGGESCSDVRCLTTAADTNAAEMRTFVSHLDAIDFPSDVDAEVSALRRVSMRLVDDLEEMSAATTTADYRRAVRETGVNSDANGVDTDVRRLNAALDYRGG